jgi:hypothetical protein
MITKVPQYVRSGIEEGSGPIEHELNRTLVTINAMVGLIKVSHAISPRFQVLWWNLAAVEVNHISRPDCRRCREKDKARSVLIVISLVDHQSGSQWIIKKLVRATPSHHHQSSRSHRRVGLEEIEIHTTGRS